MSYESSGPRASHHGAELISTGSTSNFFIQETEVTDLVLAETRLEALRSLALVFLREVNALKKILGQKRHRSSEDPIEIGGLLQAASGGKQETGHAGRLSSGGILPPPSLKRWCFGIGLSSADGDRMSPLQVKGCEYQ